MCDWQQGQEEGDSLSSYVWDLHNPNVPECELRPGSALTCVNYNLKDSNLLGAGQYNGQVSFFDVRKGSVPVDSSQLEHSHRQAACLNLEPLNPEPCYQSS